MRLSIVIPALNEAAEIQNVLSALQPMRCDGAEVIVVDGGSADGTAGLALPMADQVIVTARGRARQMNAGAAIAMGEVLLFLHADTHLPTQADQAVFHALQVGGRFWGRFDVHIAGRPALLPVIAALMNFRSRVSGIATGDQAIFVRRDVFFAVGSYPDLPLMEDIVLSSRLKRTGRPACLRQQVITSGRRWEQRGFWKTVWLMWSLRLQFFFGRSAASLAERYHDKDQSCSRLRVE
jgi:rSAM/selenodomain-associated transferase 2